jgi:hypothetical protein
MCQQVERIHFLKSAVRKGPAERAISRISRESLHNPIHTHGVRAPDAAQHVSFVSSWPPQCLGGSVSARGTLPQGTLLDNVGGLTHGTITA